MHNLKKHHTGWIQQKRKKKIKAKGNDNIRESIKEGYSVASLRTSRAPIKESYY